MNTKHMEICTYVNGVDVVDALEGSGGIVVYIGKLSYIPHSRGFLFARTSQTLGKSQTLFARL